MVITQTPFRMSFFGGGTDFKEFYEEHGGSVLSTSFDKYCYLTVRHLPRFFEYANQITYSVIERTNTAGDIRHPAVREAMKWLDMHEISIAYEAALTNFLIFISETKRSYRPCASCCGNIIQALAPHARHNAAADNKRTNIHSRRFLHELLQQYVAVDRKSVV